MTAPAYVAAPIHQAVRPDIPARYDGNQAAFDRDMALLQVRRQIMERAHAIAEARALITIHQADAAERRERLERDDDTPGFTHPQRLRLTGQALLATARANALQERIQQLELEITAYAATLVDRSA